MKKIVLTLLLACMASLSFAQWSTDASVNNTFFSGGAPYEPMAATDAATGNTYVSWFVLESGEMHQKLQLVDVYGVPQWADNGIYISTHTNTSALYGTALTTSTDGCAVLMFCDMRTETYLPFAYKISPTGEFVWGADGIQISTAEAMRCYLSPCNDGSAWAAWMDGVACFARHISSDGLTLGPIITISSAAAGGTTTFGHIITDDSNNMIMAYFEGTGTFMWPNREMYVCKYNTQGNQVWTAPTLLMASQSMNFARDLELIPDGLGGGYTTCYIPSGDIHQAVLFHFDANGIASTPTMGIYVSSNGMVHNYNEVTTVDPTTHNSIVAFIKAESGEVNRGLNVQSIDMYGNKLWGEEGIELLPFSTNNVLSLHIAAVPTGGAIINYIQNDCVKAIRIDGNGQKVWAGESVNVSVSTGTKSSCDFATDVCNGQLIIPWLDETNDQVKAQNIKLDGTLGPVTVDNPNVEITIGEVTNTTVEATFTPNEACASYYIMIGTQAEMEMWMQMMQMTLEQLVQMWGIQMTTQETYTWTDQAPNTEYTVYALPLDAAGNMYTTQTQIATTTGGGGAGEALVTIAISEITETSVRMIVTPNDQTSVFYDGLITLELFNEIGQDSAVEIIKNNGYPLYETDDWTWSNLNPNTTYKAIGIGQNSENTWGAPAIEEFSTTGGSICNPPTNLTAVLASDETSIELSWTAPADRGVMLYESFETGALPAGWAVLDADGDGYTWDAETGFGVFVGHTGECISSASYLNTMGALTPDNYLITPMVEGATSVNYWVNAQDAAYAYEHYAVCASTTGTNAADFTVVFEETMTAKSGAKGIRGANAQGAWYERTVELPAGTKYVAFRHYNCTDAFWLNLDDVTVNGEGSINFYNVYRDGVVIAENVAATSYTDANLTPGDYCYTVKTVCEAGLSEASNEACETVPEPASCPKPTNLTAASTLEGIDLAWNYAGGDPLSWSTAYAQNAIGTGSAAEFSCAQRWTVADLAGYNGKVISSIMFAPHQETCTFTLKIWVGGSQSAGPAQEVYSQEVTSFTPAQENTIELTTPYTINATQDLWVGYHCVATTGHPAGVDAGPAIDGKGNMMLFDGAWTTLLALGSSLNYNWAIQANVEDNTTFNVYRDGVAIAEDLAELSYSDNDIEAGEYCYTVTANCGTEESEMSDEACAEYAGPCDPTVLTAEPVDGNIVLTWTAVSGAVNYKVYYGATLIKTTSDLTHTVSNPSVGVHCFTVVTVCEAGNSDPSNEACAEITSISENESAFNVFPNPANDKVTIEGENIESIAVYNVLGQMVDNIKVVSQSSQVINTTAYESGMYIFRIVTREGNIASKRVVIAH